jgi:hypothetical protein
VASEADWRAKAVLTTIRQLWQGAHADVVTEMVQQLLDGLGGFGDSFGFDCFSHGLSFQMVCVEIDVSDA